MDNLILTVLKVVLVVFSILFIIGAFQALNTSNRKQQHH